jgi:hypothetical protein
MNIKITNGSEVRFQGVTRLEGEPTVHPSMGTWTRLWVSVEDRIVDTYTPGPGGLVVEIDEWESDMERARR